MAAKVDLDDLAKWGSKGKSHLYSDVGGKYCVGYIRDDGYVIASDLKGEQLVFGSSEVDDARKARKQLIDSGVLTEDSKVFLRGYCTILQVAAV